MRVAYFTGGTVGAGHLVRGIAIGRGLRRAGFDGPYRMFGPALPFALAEQRRDYDVVEIRDDEALRSRSLAAGSEIAGRLARFRPDLLLVDLFWAPLYWVLPQLGCLSWLLLRLCPEHWLEGPSDTPFDPAAYDRIIAIEPLAYQTTDSALDPIVVANPAECRPAGALRARCGGAADEPLEVVLHAGQPGEIRALRRAARQPSPVVLDLRQSAALFPAAEWLSGADRIISGAGYNAYWEARWLGYAERTTFVPMPRTIDDQALRVAACGEYVMRENGADTLARWIRSVEPETRCPD